MYMCLLCKCMYAYFVNVYLCIYCICVYVYIHKLQVCIYIYIYCKCVCVYSYRIYTDTGSMYICMHIPNLWMCIHVGTVTVYMCIYLSLSLSYYRRVYVYVRVRGMDGTIVWVLGEHLNSACTALVSGGECTMQLPLQWQLSDAPRTANGSHGHYYTSTYPVPLRQPCSRPSLLLLHSTHAHPYIICNNVPATLQYQPPSSLKTHPWYECPRVILQEGGITIVKTAYSKQV